jgi:hypothetical protein
VSSVAFATLVIASGRGADDEPSRPSPAAVASDAEARQHAIEDAAGSDRHLELLAAERDHLVQRRTESGTMSKHTLKLSGGAIVHRSEGPGMGSERQTVRRAVVAGSVSVLAGVVSVTTAAAAGANPADGLTFHYFNCVGPPGTPASFDAVKSHGFAFDVVGSNAVWTLLHVESVATGEVFVDRPAAMLANQAVPPVTCLIDSPVRHEPLRATGTFAPSR